MAYNKCMNAFSVPFLFSVTKWPICLDYALMSNLIFHLTQAPRSVEKSGGGLKRLGGRKPNRNWLDW